jgi:hypothetical protein
VRLGIIYYTIYTLKADLGEAGSHNGHAINSGIASITDDNVP